jgi:hypothetical protein
MNTPPPSELPHTIKRNPITGTVTVHFACPTCRAALHAPILDAGTADRCPECQGTFRTPGMGARVQEEKRLAAKIDAQAKADAEAHARSREEAARAIEAEATKQRAMQAAAVLDRQRSARIPYTRPAARTAILLVCVGLLAVLMGVVGSPTLATCGTILVAAGFVVDAIARLGREVNRWGTSHSAQAGQTQTHAGQTTAGQ